MSDSEQRLDPEVVGIVRSIVQTPGSTLFRVPTHASPGAFALRDPAVTEGEPFLSRVERYLLQAHRDALGVAFLAACKAKLMEPPATESLLFPVDPQSLGDWRTRGRRLMERHRWEEEREDVRTLEQAIEGSSVSAATLARISLRLNPGDDARICMALGMGQEGDREGAIETLERVAGGGPVDAHFSRAHHNLGFMHYEAGDLAHAQLSYRTAAERESDVVEYVGCWFTSSLLLGDRQGALAAASLLVPGESYEQFLSITRSSLGRLESQAAERAYLLGRAILDKVPEVARRVVDAFVSE